MDPQFHPDDLEPGMANPNDVDLIRIFTQRNANGVEDLTPITPGGNTFFVTVEGEAGAVLGQSSQPYTLRISALDLDDGANPNSAQNNFTQLEGGNPAFDAAHGWPNKRVTFTVTLNDVAAVNGRTLVYRARLLSQNQIVSIVESKDFILQQ
jgi:hypothetical protein